MQQIKYEVVLERIQECVASHLCVGNDEVLPDTTFESLGADSLDHVEIITALEDTFGIGIPDNVAEEFKTSRQAADWLADKVP